MAGTNTPGSLRQLGTMAAKSCSSSTVDDTYWEKLQQSFAKVGFADEFEQQMLSKRPTKAEPPAVGDTVPVSTTLDGVCCTVSIDVGSPLRSAHQSACENFKVDPAMYEVPDSSSLWMIKMTTCRHLRVGVFW